MAKTVITPLTLVKITLATGHSKLCKTASQAARFYADTMTPHGVRWNDATGWTSWPSYNYQRCNDTRYRRSYAVFAKILPKRS